MTFPGFTSLTAAWLFLLLAPLIIFYFLKLRRPRMEIPSLALWRQVIADQRVNSPFQKFKRNLLLLLQILLLCALILAAMQPFWPSGTDRAQYIPVLIDCSASMAALDVPNGQTRLDAAKAEVRKLIDNLLPDQRLSLIGVDSTARRLVEFTDNQRALHAALDDLTVRPVTSRLEDGLRMAQALARTQAVQTVVLVTDGNVPAAVDFELPFRLNFQRIPTGGANVGITECNARHTEAGWDVFLRLDAGPKPTEGTLGEQRLVEITLLQNGQPLKQETLGVTAGDSARMTFPVQTTTASSLEIRIKPDGFDALELDNTAFLELPEPRRASVFCPPELSSYRQALLAQGDVDVWPREGATTPNTVDLRFSDQLLTGIPTARVLVTTGVIPEDLQPLVTIDTKLADVVDWNRTATLLRHVQLLDVQIADDPVSNAGIGDRDYELAGYEILAQGSRGPLILQKPTLAGIEYRLLFHTDRSSLPYRVGFPIFIANAVQSARDRAGLSEARARPTGVLPLQQLQPDTEYQFVAPDGRSEAVRSNPEGIVAGLGVDLVGRYALKQGGTDVATFGVSLLAPTESGLGAVDKLLFPETSVSTAAEIIRTDRPLWGWFAWAALGFLLFEWWWFQRRPGALA